MKKSNHESGFVLIGISLALVVIGFIYVWVIQSRVTTMLGEKRLSKVLSSEMQAVEALAFGLRRAYDLGTMPAGSAPDKCTSAAPIGVGGHRQTIPAPVGYSPPTAQFKGVRLCLTRNDGKFCVPHPNFQNREICIDNFTQNLLARAPDFNLNFISSAVAQNMVRDVDIVKPEDIPAANRPTNALDPAKRDCRPTRPTPYSAPSTGSTCDFKCGFTGACMVIRYCPTVFRGNCSNERHYIYQTVGFPSRDYF